MSKRAPFILLTALLSLFGCNGNGGHGGPGGDNGQGPDVAPVAAGELRDNIGFNKQLLIALVPFEGPILYQAHDAKVGPEAELGRAIHARIQQELGDDIRVVWVNKTYRNIIDSVAGEPHLGMGMLGITDARELHVDFSDSYYTSELRLAYNPVIKIVNSNNLDGIKVGVREGTAAAEFVTAQYPNSTIENEGTVDDLVLALRRGELDAIIDDQLLLQFSLATVAGARNLELDEKVLGEIPVGIALPKGSTWLKGLVNEVIAEVQGEGQLAGWLDEHVTDEMEAVEERDDVRERKNQLAKAPRQVVVRVSKDDGLSFDIFRLANLPFTFRDADSGKTYTSSRLNFQQRVGVASLRLPPATYRFRLQKWDAVGGSVQISTGDKNRINISVRLRADNTVRVTRN